MRIVAEAALTRRLVADFAVPAADGHERLGIVGRAHGRQHAGVVRPPVVLALQSLDQKTVVGRIIARLSCKAGR